MSAEDFLTKKNLLYLVGGLVLAVVLWNGFYYWEVLKWVDQKRIGEILANVKQQQAAQVAQPAPTAK